MTYTDADLSGTLIRETRTALNRTQVEFASVMGVSNITISRWENNHLPQSVSHRRALIQLANKYLEGGE